MKIIDTVAIVGCGIVGCGWIPVFTRAGCHVRLYDSDPARLGFAEAWHRDFESRTGTPESMAKGSLSVHTELAAAVSGAGYVQESVVEDMQLKRRVFRDIDAVVEPDAYIASSTSTLDINEIARDAVHQRRCFTAHPFNPAAVLPVVEVLGTAASTPEDVAGIRGFLERAGQMPVVLRKFVPAYVGNRLQAAIMREALHLVTSGVIDANGVDALVSHALALRWVPLGIFGTNHTNDESGLRAYYGRFWKSYQGVMATLAVAPPVLDDASLGAIADAVDRRFDSATVAEIARWRDVVVNKLRRLQDDNPFQSGARD